jgi:hypothetical protein
VSVRVGASYRTGSRSRVWVSMPLWMLVLAVLTVGPYWLMFKLTVFAVSALAAGWRYLQQHQQLRH